MTWPSWAKSEWNNESVTVYEKIVSLILQVQFIKTRDVDYVRLMIGKMYCSIVMRVWFSFDVMKYFMIIILCWTKARS